MTIQRLFKRFAVAATVAVIASTAQAALFDRGNGMIYDDHSNITWLSNLNVNGLMTWDAAVAWSDNLTYGGYSDWRLPTLNPSDASCTGGFGVGDGYNCTGGELSHLFVTGLGNRAGESLLTQTGDTPQQLANQALFSNAQSYAYWSGSEYAPGTGVAWGFGTVFGYQDDIYEHVELFAVAVRPGDVLSAVTPVPEPQSWLLMLLGLGAVASVVRRKAA